MITPATIDTTGRPRKGAWEVTATTLSGHRYHYCMETERDADLLAIALQAHSKEIAGTQVNPL